MTVLYVPRSLGGTLILTISPPPTSTIPTASVTLAGRDGTQPVKGR